jgi:RNA polymerase sigma-70 factor (ECF subfamily)
LKVIQLHKNSIKNQKRLVQKLKKNRRGAQQETFELYASKMLGVCRQYIKDLQHAEEIMLNGFLKTFTKINQFKSNGSFEGWIRRIMINECISFLRIKKRMVFIDDDSFFEQPIEIEFIEDSQVSELQQLVDNLREDLRVVFNLFVVEEYKHKEIAKTLNITENASKLRYRKAKSILQKQYNNLNLKSYEK